MKKILHIPNYYLPHIGGIEDVCHSIVVATASCHRHYVLCFNDGRQTQRDTVEGVEVVRSGVWKKLFSQSVSFSLLLEMKRAFREINPDIVHFHVPNPLATCFLIHALPARTQLVVHWHSDIIEQKSLYPFFRLFETKLLSRAGRVLATSPAYLRGSVPLRSVADKVRVIPNTVNTSKLEKREYDEEAIAGIRKRYKGNRIVFTFGRHVPYKGLHHLVDAARYLERDAVVVIAGQGPLTAELRSRSNDPRIHFPGRLTDDELRHYLYAADVFAFPSVTRNEAFGIALAEAMYCGLPSVTFSIPDSGVNWVCPDGETGLESENGNSHDLAFAINRLLNDEKLRTRLGSNAAARARKLFTGRSIREDILNLYD